MSALDDIFSKLSFGYEFEMSDYATSKHAEDEYEKIGLAEIAKAKRAINKLIAEAYKKGFADGAIEVINNTCELCHAYPMTVNCNNGGCDE